MKFFLLFLFASIYSFSFPQFSTHKYPNCTACHVSPNGGGLLTAYGRSLSKELISTWGTEKETKPFYGTFSLPEWLSIGGDVRVLQSYLNTSLFEQARFFLMQADLEAGVSVSEWQFVATFGYQNPSSSRATQSKLISRRHYLLYRLNDEWNIRAGRFQAAFGINSPDHFISTRKDLGWDESSETYNLEASYLGDKFDLFITGILGRPDNQSLNAEKGFALRSSYNLTESSKAGLGFYYGSSPLNSRFLVGPMATLSFTSWLSLMGELDFQFSNPTGAIVNKVGLVDYLRLNAEVVKGLHIYLAQELSRFDLNKGEQTKEAYSVGFQWFPRPHFELSLGFRKQRNLIIDSRFGDFAWFLGHFYL